MKLQILVPQWKETATTIKPLLDSIALQQGVDLDEVGVIIVNDGSDVLLPQDFLNAYPYKIEYYRNIHAGVSATRNACLNKATADYVMFCDADDMFLSNCGLWIIFRSIDEGEFDVFVSAFSEESFNGETVNYITHPNTDATFVHGKVYRRQFLIDKNIYWNPELTIHEDSYFNYLARACAGKDKIKLSDNIFYLWRYRPDSICRTEKDYLVKTYDHMIKSQTALIDRLITKGKLQAAEEVAANMIFRTYFFMNGDSWNDENNLDIKEETMKQFKAFFKKYNPLAEMLDEKLRNKMWIELRNKYTNEGIVFERITFKDWKKAMSFA